MKPHKCIADSSYHPADCRDLLKHLRLRLGEHDNETEMINFLAIAATRPLPSSLSDQVIAAVICHVYHIAIPVAPFFRMLPHKFKNIPQAFTAQGRLKENFTEIISKQL